MREYAQIGKMMSHAIDVQIIPKSNVKIHKVTDFRSLIREGVDFSKLKKAVLIKDCIIAEKQQE